MPSPYPNPTFLDELFAGNVRPADIDEWVIRWNEQPDEWELHEYLGLTWPEYELWVNRGTLPGKKSRFKTMHEVMLEPGPDRSDGEIINAHGPAVCSPPCAIHWPSDHSMRSWRQTWRQDRRIIERVCPQHEVGHPDPDDLAIRMERDPGVHGCCGCCRDQPSSYVGRRRAPEPADAG